MLPPAGKNSWGPSPAFQAGLATLCLLAAVGGSARGDSLLWYGGDTGPSSTFSDNNTQVTPGIGSSVLDDFVVPSDWHVTGLFSNNEASYPIDTAPFTEAVWSIRTGVGPGDPGNILFSGVSPVTVTPTGRPSEYTVAVSGLSLDLAPGVYFMNVSPVAPIQIYYVSDSDGTNAVGVPGPSNAFREDSYNVDGTLQVTVGELASDRMSMGVIGIGAVAVPEPATFVCCAEAAVMLVGLSIWRRRRRCGNWRT